MSGLAMLTASARIWSIRHYECSPEDQTSWNSMHYRRKFRSQTSDNMERWKSSQQGEESEEKRSQEKKMQVREKEGKSRNSVFFRGFVAPEGWKVGSLKRRVRRHLGRWEMKSCTPLWREADFEVKRYKTPQDRSDCFWKLRCWKSARRCGAKHIWK